VLAPAGTPQAVVDKLNAEINKHIQSSEMQAFFIKEGAEPAPMKPDEFARFISAEIERWKGVAKAADIRPE
jgi:tripartite-type tricarboxylate transporter receptor subunit TctC